jgi:hypothetical protein
MAGVVRPPLRAQPGVIERTSIIAQPQNLRASFDSRITSFQARPQPGHYVALRGAL